MAVVLDYFTERLDPTVTRVALARALQQAKRNKALESSGGIGLAVDGSNLTPYDAVALTPPSGPFWT